MPKTSWEAISDRFFAKIERTDTCWLWRGSQNGSGYGEMRIDGKKQYAHRIAYQLFNGEIPDRLQIDHLCRVRSCVRPDHLEAVTAHVNIMRSTNPDVQRARAAAVTHCPQGHAYAEANTYVTKTNLRQCKTCTRSRNRRRREAARA